MTQSTYSFLYGHRRCAVKTMTYSQSRARYAEVLDGVLADREEVVITRAGHEPVVILSLADYESLKETAYLLQNPANARRLLASIERLESGAAGDVLDQFVDPLDDAPVLGLPVQVVGPGVGVPDVPHPASSCSAPAPDSSRSIEASRRRALAGFCSR